MFTKDENQIIGQMQENGTYDGGDSVNWMGHYIYLTGDKDNFPFVETFEKGFGGYVRHPDPKRSNNGFAAHYKNPWDGVISRDQLVGIIAGLIAKGARGALLRAAIHHAAWLFLFSYNNIKNGVNPNNNKDGVNWKWPDLTLFNTWALYLRGFGLLSTLTYPILCILDLHLLVSTLLTNRSKDNDKINYAMRMIIAKDNTPTLISKLAWKILDKDNLVNLIKDYWSGWRGKNSGMIELYERKING
jgi:hypothetical protein